MSELSNKTSMTQSNSNDIQTQQKEYLQEAEKILKKGEKNSARIAEYLASEIIKCLTQKN